MFLYRSHLVFFFFFFQAEDGIRDLIVTGVQTCALPISFLRNACVARRPAYAPRKHCEGKRDFYGQNGNEHQILTQQYVAEAKRGSEVGLNAAAFVSKAVVSRRHQNQNEICHHAWKKHLRGDAPTSHSRMPSGKIHTKDKYEQRR